ncbi:hypothetical protein IPV08_06590 [Methylobacterium sp. SD274]|uniref:hypothetical protein n=1 Tax=unclassified Methylobacterium TaxID=2615210 RepID=UPI001A970529|nr:hypothetical protein [Methylobacterium sp. SD274]MBO1019634.1 hypothetical protein [Methylobacterium sp. SD274]
MSAGLFQNLPGAHEMGSVHALPSEPWLLPISDGKEPALKTTDDILLAVRQSARPFQIAANALMVLLLVAVTAQIAMGWGGSTVAPHANSHVADASPPTLPIEKASMTVHN